jgi:hypothetical protein
VLLARAFDQAWNGYYRLGRLVTISEDVARRALATVLIRLERGHARGGRLGAVRDQAPDLNNAQALGPSPSRERWSQIRAPVAHSDQRPQSSRRLIDYHAPADVFWLFDFTDRQVAQPNAEPKSSTGADDTKMI